MTDRRRRLWLLLLALPTVAGITILAWRYAAVPITNAIWSLRRFVTAFDQGAIWVVLVFFFAVSVLSALRGVNTEVLPPKPRGSRDTARTRTTYWHRLLSQGTTRRHSSQPLVTEVRHLVLCVLAHTDVRPAAELECEILSRRIAVPECVLRLFLQKPRWEQPRGRLARLFRRAGSDVAPQIDMGWLEEVVAFLEHRLAAGRTRLPEEEGR